MEELVSMPCKGCGKDKSHVATYGFTLIRWEGQGLMKVHGGMSGRTYRFDGYGSVIPIENKDLEAVKMIPRMRIIPY